MIDLLGKLVLAFQEAPWPIKLATLVCLALIFYLVPYYLVKIAKTKAGELKSAESRPEVSIQGDRNQINIGGRDVIVQQQINNEVNKKIDDIHRIVNKVDRSVQQLGIDFESVQKTLTTQIEMTSSGCQRFSRDNLPEEIQKDILSGHLFYERYLEKEFPKLPDEIFIEIVSMRATPHAASAVQFEFVTEHPLLAVFWAYKGYGTVKHARSYIPPQYTIAIAPLLSQKWMKVYFIDSESFNSPTLSVIEWKK